MCGQRHPDIRRFSTGLSAEAWRCDANDGEWRALEAERAADDRGAAAEPPRPVRVAEHRNRLAVRQPVVSRPERAADAGADAQGGEVVPADPFEDNRLGWTIDADGVRARRRRRNRVDDACRLGRKLPERGVREQCVVTVRTQDAERDQLVWSLDGQGAQHHRVDDAEDGGVGADAEREDDDRHRRERRRTPQGTSGIADVPPEVLDAGFPTGVACLFFHGIQTSDLEPRGPDRGVRRQTAPDLCVDGSIEVGTELLVELSIGTTAPEQRQYTRDEPVRPRHQSFPSEARRILVIAAVCSSHSRVSRLNFARPCAVSV